MSIRSISPVPRGIAALFCALLTVTANLGQTKPTQQPQPEADDVVRVNTELVQTDVMVFDKKGHFVDGLKADQFALKIDNKPQPISFFERVTSGGRRETQASRTQSPDTYKHCVFCNPWTNHYLLH